jgi:serine/threonine-protein kinase
MGQRLTATLQLGGAPHVPRPPAPDEDEERQAPHRRRPSLMPGTVLRETYQIVRHIGQGGMGDVYEAKHARLTGRYAVKVLPPEFALNPAVLSRFRREAEIASGLQHPNIVQVIDFHETDDGTPYLVMEYLDGEDLAALMARRGSMSLAEAMPMIEQIGAALTAVHRRGIVHRDVKPQNVFLIAQDHGRTLLKLVDFGLSKANAPSLVVTRQPMLLGTPQYMAPEQALARVDELGPATDQFALAAIIYQMLSGRPPFVGERISSVLYQIVHEDPPPLGASADPPIEAVLLRALSKKGEDRFPSMEDFVDALRATLGLAADGTGREPRPAAASSSASQSLSMAAELIRPDGEGASSPLREDRARRRRRLVAVAAAAFLATLALLIGLNPLRGRRAGVGPPRAETTPSATPGVSPPPSAPGSSASATAAAPTPASATAPGAPSVSAPPSSAGAGEGSPGARAAQSTGVVASDPLRPSGSGLASRAKPHARPHAAAGPSPGGDSGARAARARGEPRPAATDPASSPRLVEDL